MFINSIFLPKNISDQTLPEGVAGKIGNFSHLFSNVFRILKDEQENSLPIQLVGTNPNIIENPQNELLKVSLLSDNKFTLENSNISSIVAAFISKLSPGEFTEELTDTNKIKVYEKIPKYFSLNKNEFIKEIKNIIDSLKNGDAKNLENVEISIIANGQSININPLTTNIVDLENWVTEQLQSNTDFEILVKSGQQQLAADIEPVKNEVLKTEGPVQIISVVKDDCVEAGNNNTVVKEVISPTPISKNIGIEGSASQQLVTGLIQTYVNENEEILKPQILSTQNFTTPIQSNYSQTFSNNNIVSKLSLNTEMNVQEKVGKDLHENIPAKLSPELDVNVKNNISSSNEVKPQNTSISKINLLNKMTFETQDELVARSESFTKKENVLSDSNLKLQKVSSEKPIDTTIKSSNSEVKVQSNSLQTAENAKNLRTGKQTPEVNVKEKNQSDNKINIKSNQKINSVLLNKNSVQGKVVLTDLIEKANVKDIKIIVQDGDKSGNTNSPKYQDVYQPELSSVKENTTKNQTPQPAVEIKKVLTIDPEFKQSSIENTSNKVVDEVKSQNNPKLRVQQELFIESEFVENEKPVLIKNESIKTTNSNQQTLKEIPAIEADDKIKTEKNNLEQHKTITVDSPKAKLEVIGNSLTRKIIPPEIEKAQRISEQKTNTQQVEVENLKIKTIDSGKIVNSFNLKDKTVSKPASLLVDDNSETTISTQNGKSVVKENSKETVSFKTNSNLINTAEEKTEVSSTLNPEKNTSNQKAKLIVENLRTRLKEFSGDETKQENVIKNQFENKTVKIDFMQRRVYSQIPKLEVMAAEAEVKNVKTSVMNVEMNKNENTQLIDETVKSTQNPIEQKPKAEKQVWVKVSLEKNDSETISEIRKSSHQQNKITIDANSDGMKKEFDKNNYSDKDSREYPKQKTQIVQVEASQNTEVKTTNQITTTQQDLTAGLKTETKSDNISFKTPMHSEETKFNSRSTEMIEKIKVISSGEMIREITKVFESGEKQSIVLRLVPKELGSVKIILDTVDNVLTAKVEVENETVGHIVRNNVDQLKQNLLQNGVHVNSINISYHNSDQKQHGFNNQKRKNSGYLPENDIEDVDEAVVSKKMGYNTYEYLA